MASPGPPPHPNFSTRDPYVQMEVRAFDKNIGTFFGTVIGTNADRTLVSVRSEGRAVNTIEMITELSLKEYSQMSPVKIRELRSLRENSRASVASTVEATEFSGLPEACQAWPELFSKTEIAAGSGLSTSAPTSSSNGMQQSIVPSDWLLQNALLQSYLDVIVHGGTTKISAEYDNRVGVIRNLEQIKRGKRGSVKIRFGRGICTDRWIPIRNVFPLTTTEFEGITARGSAKPILDVMGIYVVIIGPDADGRQSFIGSTGFTSWGGKNITLLVVGLKRFVLVCDGPCYRAAEQSQVSALEEIPPVHAPQVSFRRLLSDGVQVHDDLSSDFRLRGVDSPLSAGSPGHDIDEDIQNINPYVDDGQGSGIYRNALQLSFDDNISFDGTLRRDSIGYNEDNLPPRRSLTSGRRTSGIFVSQEDLHGPGESFLPSASMPDRFTAELRARMILGFRDGSIPDFDTFKSLLYAPIVLSPTSLGRATSLEGSTSDALHSPQSEEWNSDVESPTSDGGMDLSYPEDVLATSSGLDIDPATDNGREIIEDEHIGTIVYQEDYEAYGEDLLTSRAHRKQSAAISARKTKKKPPKARNLTITSFFARTRQWRVKAALVRRLRHPPRSLALSGPAGSSLASAQDYNPRIHRPEVLPTAVAHVPKVPGSGSCVGGTRVSRALPLRVEDLQLVSHPVILPCEHVACYVCIRVFLEYKWECPACRVIVTKAPVVAEAREAEIRAQYGDWDRTRVCYSWKGLTWPSNGTV
ncbi:hypothetical protein R3P38DRAFT_2794797 [Favolaschia claudopus]|uniref:RING-type domain-containing protein n=1 Tax=Favolaschia claudopus TaxID=2862362 RepID=A0AAW0A825_9AGAR